MATKLIGRRAAGVIVESLEDTRVVLVVGPRQAGKTTLVRTFATAARPYLTLDDQGTLDAARRDPIGFIRGLDGAVIDEIQRAPELMLAIKRSVDENPMPGRFLLTGSANVMALPTVGDNLAGRVQIVPLLPLSQSEMHGTAGSFIDKVFSGDLPGIAEDAVVGRDLDALVLQGGYPEAIARHVARRRSVWFDDYLALILGRDVRDISTIEQLAKLPTLVRLLAEQSGQLANQSNLASALQLARVTITRYLEVLERLFLIRTIPPWFSNRTSRLIKSPKLTFLDSGLLASRLDVADAPNGARSPMFGALLETFVAGELWKMLGWSDTRATLSHFRTKEQDEVDFVLEDQRGRVVGIEVKASATLRRGDFNGLRKLQAAAGDKFVRGLVLHDHDRTTPISEHLHGMPISVLWSSQL